MKNSTLWTLWGCLYIVCAIGGCLPVQDGIGKWILIFLSLVFFVPPAILLYLASRSGNKKSIRRIRNISFGWLVGALVLILCNILSVLADQLTGQILYYALAILSSPMICGQVWVVSLFLFSCLMIAAHRELKK